MLRASDPQILLLNMGGTLSARAAHSLDLLNYAASGKHYTAAEIAARLAEIVGKVGLVPIDIFGGDSAALAPADWCGLSAVLQRELDRDGIIGAVILHGTSTLEEAAYFISLTFAAAKPVIFTGAMRPLDTIGSDALTNAWAAVVAAGEARLAAYGPLVVINDEIHPAREVEKIGTYALDSFRSRGGGPIGRINPDHSVVLRAQPPRARSSGPSLRFSGGALPRVDMVTSFSGADGIAIRASVETGAAAIVHCGLSPGVVTPQEAEAIAEAVRRGVIVVQSCYAADGPVLKNYQTVRLGTIPARDLSPKKARLLVMLLIASGFSKSKIEEIWDCF